MSRSYDWFPSTSPGRSKWFWLAIFILFAIALRWGSFFISVINHDESTYIVIANEMLRGEVYLRDVIDTKPIGIFWVYAGLIRLTGGSVVMLRAAAAVVVGLGSWGLYLANRRALGSTKAGVAAGIAYALLCSVFGYYGLSPNTEIFFNALTIAAVAIGVVPCLPRESHYAAWRWLATGLLLGLAFCIKPFAAAESLAIGLFLLYTSFRRRKFLVGVGHGLVLFGAFLLPVLGVVAYYRDLGMLDTLLFYSFDVNAAYPVDLPWYLRVKYMGDYLLRFSPAVMLAIATCYYYLGAGAQVQTKVEKSQVEVTSLAISEKRNAGVTWIVYLIVQFALVTAVVLSTGKRFGHYQVQLHPVLALLAGAWWATGRSLLPTIARRRIHRYAPLLIVVLSLGLGALHFSRYQSKVDEPTRIATYLRGKLTPGETFFTINGRQMAYYLLDRDVPTPYVHSSLLFLDHHVAAFQIDERAEAQRIIDNQAVSYLVSKVADVALKSTVSQALLPYFSPQDTIDTDLVIWHRK